MAKTVKRYVSKLPVGMYRATKACEIYIGNKRQYIPEGKVVSLGKGEANKNFEVVSLNGAVPNNDKTASIINALDRLDEKNAAHWTKVDGLPMLSVIQTMAGDPDITRKDVSDARPGFCRMTLEVENANNPKDEDENTFGQGSDERNKNHQEV